MSDFKALLAVMLEKNISDIHLKVGSNPLIRLNGELLPASDEKLDIKVVEDMVDMLLDEQQKKKYIEERDIDFAFSIDDLSRFRVNISTERGRPIIVLRVIPTNVSSFDELNLPFKVLEELSRETRGLILVAGTTGAGKTTTMNSMIDFINSKTRSKIITIEDPIEYYHCDKESSISQREIGRDVKSFEQALKHSLRQDPDVIVIGELRNFDAMQASVIAAETGHLVIATIHTVDATQTVERIVSSYPPHLQQGACFRLASVIKGIIAQRLVISKDKQTQYPINEILINTSHIRNTIAEGKFSELSKAIEQGAFYKMQSFDQNLCKLYSNGKISYETALEYATNQDDIILRIKGIERTS